MDTTFNIVHEITKGVSAKREITTQLDFHCESEADVKTLTANITKVLTKHLTDVNLAKITYEYYPSEKKVEVVIIEHVHEAIKF